MFPQRWEAGPATDACCPVTPASGLFQDAGWRQVDIRKAQPCEELLSLSETLMGQVLSWSSGSWSEPLLVYTVGVLSMSHLMIMLDGVASEDVTVVWKPPLSPVPCSYHILSLCLSCKREGKDLGPLCLPSGPTVSHSVIPRPSPGGWQAWRGSWFMLRVHPLENGHDRG